jgi:hypothetical protein
MLFEADDVLMERAVNLIEDVGKIHAFITGFAPRFGRSPNRSPEVTRLIDHATVLLNEASRELNGAVAKPRVMVD